MDRLHLMSVFVAVAEAEGFAAAARRLSMSPPAVTRAVAALEERLGVRLLNRSTRLVRVTEAGARYLADCRRIIAEADEADESAAGLNAEPRGLLHLTAPVLFGGMYVTPVVTAYLRRHPGVNAACCFLDRVVNLLEEGMDVAVRIGELPDSNLRAVPVGRVRRVICGAPAYLAERGVPRHPEDLAAHSLISAGALNPGPEWRLVEGGVSRAWKVAPRLSTTSNDSALAAAVDGFGLTMLLSYQVAAALADGRLQRVLEDYEPPALPIHVVHREDGRPSAKVRAFVDLAVEMLRAEPGLR